MPRLPRFLSAALAAALLVTASSSAARADGPPPVYSFAVGNVVATRDTLTVDPVTLGIGSTATMSFRFLFELQVCCENGDFPARFLAAQADPACHVIGEAPYTRLECEYTREVVAFRDELFVFHFGITRPAESGEPSVMVMMFSGGATADIIRNAKRVSPESDFVVTTGRPAAGRVGEVVNFERTLTNVGLDPVYWRAGMITMTAPAGTEFVSPSPIGGGDLECFGPLATPTFRHCWFDLTEPGPAGAHKQVLQLRILSSTVGQGQISAQMANYLGRSPEMDYVDPTPDNNVAPIKVSLPRLPPIRF